MDKAEPTISELKSLGPKSQEMLARVGILTVQQLEEVGAVAAYARATRANPGKRHSDSSHAPPSEAGQRWPPHCLTAPLPQRSAPIHRDDAARCMFEMCRHRIHRFSHVFIGCQFIERSFLALRIDHGRIHAFGVFA